MWVLFLWSQIFWTKAVHIITFYFIWKSYFKIFFSLHLARLELTTSSSKGSEMSKICADSMLLTMNNTLHCCFYYVNIAWHFRGVNVSLSFLIISLKMNENQVIRTPLVFLFIHIQKHICQLNEIVKNLLWVAFYYWHVHTISFVLETCFRNCV